MRLLFASDFQADFDNLDLCQRAADEMLGICRAHHLYGIVIAGDLKRQYNPTDLRVIHFWMDFIEQATQLVSDFIIVLGNHDRLGMYTEAQNWLPILERAGAKVVHDKPRRIRVGSGALYCLPFTSSVEKTREWANSLAVHRKSVPGESSAVLVFHNDIAGSKYNVLGHESGGRLKLSDLHPELYDKCLGGHVHLRQKLGPNTWYLGSPFATDWGEANQIKGYTLLDGRATTFIPSKIPGWYDPSWPRFPKDKRDWNGCRVRIHVPIEIGQNYSNALEKARLEAERRYADATIYTVPEFKEAQVTEVAVKLSDTDAVKVRTYVRETLPDTLDRHRNAIITYLLYKLSKASQGLGLRAGGKIEFVRAKGKRFLSFDNLEIDYREPGLRLVVGRNKDWLGRSNGAGKTAYLSPVPVALFGSTFKGQKHDSWAMWRSAKSAYAMIKFRDAKGRVIRVERGRRPGRLQLFVNGKEQSSGMQSTAQAGTQGLIERLSGFTWQTLANAVYIDQAQVNTFLSGTAAEQKRILERFQNLERFAKALETVQKESRLKSVALEDAVYEKAVARSNLQAFRDMLAREQHDDTYQNALRRLQQAKGRLTQLLAKGVGDLSSRLRNAERHVQVLQDKEKSIYEALTDLEAKRRSSVARLDELKKAMDETVCPTCLQEINPKRLEAHYAATHSQFEQIVKRKDSEQKSYDAVKKEDLVLARRKVGDLKEVLLRYELGRETAAAEVAEWGTAVRTAKSYERDNRNRRQSLLKKIRQAKRDFKFWERQEEILTEEQAIIEYCVTAFSRDGIPAFLNAQLCPVLNRAAEHYSDVFTGKEIQVRFGMRDAEFEVEVINAHGGRTIRDQSTGENKMAGIIASFALRSVAPPCNLLVLDEPGDGLDPVNAKAFAVGLRKLKDSLGTVLMTTHNPVIAGELSGEQCVTIEKRGGVSRVA